MSLDALGDVNWLAIIVAALAYWALGALWYSPILFGNRWLKATGIEMEAEGPPPIIYLAPLVGYLVAAIATGMLAVSTGSDSFGDGLVLGLVVGVGYAVMLAGVTAVFDANKPSPLTWFWITAAFNLLGLVIVGVIVSIWD